MVAPSLACSRTVAPTRHVSFPITLEIRNFKPRRHIVSVSLSIKSGVLIFEFSIGVDKLIKFINSHFTRIKISLSVGKRSLDEDFAFKLQETAKETLYCCL